MVENETSDLSTENTNGKNDNNNVEFDFNALPLYPDNNNNNNSNNNNSNSNNNLVQNENNIENVGNTTDCYKPYSSLTQNDLDSLKADSYVSALLAKEMNQMTIQERNQVLEDIHGVSKQIDETPEFVQSKLREFDSCIVKVSKKKAYDIAFSQLQSYCTNERFILQFLRSDLFDVKLATERMVAFFEAKLELFGIDKLTKDITLKDMSQADIESLKSGYGQILPCCDQGGRLIILFCPPLEKQELGPLAKMRVMYYLVMIAAQNEDAQRRGAVFIACNVGPKRRFDPIAVQRAGALRNALPLRVAGMHSCIDQPILRFISSIAMLYFGKDARPRFRNHIGTIEEILNDLQPFGIPKSIMPVDTNGVYHLEYHLEWCRKQFEKETTKQSENDENDNDNNNGLIQIPRYYDVLLGRGKALTEHPGNIHFKHIIQLYQSRYDGSTRKQKGFLVDEVIRVVQCANGRFLKKQQNNVTKNNKTTTSKDDGSDDDDYGENSNNFCHYWAEVTQQYAREKVSQNFRTQRAVAYSISIANTKTTIPPSTMSLIQHQGQDENAAKRTKT